MKQYRFKISYDGRFSYSWGYALYSAFLERLDDETADEIHNDLFFNQYLTPTEWVINTEKNYDFLSEYYLKKYETTIYLQEKAVIEIEEQALADKFLVREPYKKNIRIRFLTPTTFKQSDDYVLFPTKDLIMQSLTNKWNDWAQTFILEDMTWDCCKISKYNLKSVTYNLKNTKIKGFVGYVDLFFWGSESVIRLANMVCNFGDYAGVGIKTTLGMGGFKNE